MISPKHAKVYAIKLSNFSVSLTTILKPTVILQHTEMLQDKILEVTMSNTYIYMF